MKCPHWLEHRHAQVLPRLLWLGVSGDKTCSEGSATVSVPKHELLFKTSKEWVPCPHFFILRKTQCQIFFYPAKIYSQFKSWKLHTGIIILVNQGESLFCFKTSHARKDLRNFILAWRSEIQTSTKGHWGEMFRESHGVGSTFSEWLILMSGMWWGLVRASYLAQPRFSQCQVTSWPYLNFIFFEVFTLHCTAWLGYHYSMYTLKIYLWVGTEVNREYFFFVFKFLVRRFRTC